MAEQRQKIRGSTAALNATAGRAGMVAFDTQQNELRVYDGTTIGGHRIPSLSLLDTRFDGRYNALFYTKAEMDAALDGVTDAITAVVTEVGTKANAADTTAALNTKANSATVVAGLDSKVNISSISQNEIYYRHDAGEIFGLRLDSNDFELAVNVPNKNAVLSVSDRPMTPAQMGQTFSLINSTDIGGIIVAVCAVNISRNNVTANTNLTFCTLDGTSLFTGVTPVSGWMAITATLAGKAGLFKRID